jgi:uncharacterized membrane protein YkoI
MRRLALVGVASLAVGFGAGLLAAPALRSAPPIAVDRTLREPAGGAAPAPAGRSRTSDEMARLAIAAASLERTARAPRLQAPLGAHAPAGTVGNVDNERAVTLDQLPPAIRATVSQIIQGRPMRDLTLELRNQGGRTIYETEFVLDGSEHELKMDEQGKIVESEVEFALGDLPTPVTSGIAAALPGAVLLDAEREQVRDDPAFFEINIRHAGQRYELNVAEDGRVLRTRAR